MRLQLDEICSEIGFWMDVNVLFLSVIKSDGVVEGGTRKVSMKNQTPEINLWYDKYYEL